MTGRASNPLRLLAVAAVAVVAAIALIGVAVVVAVALVVGSDRSGDRRASTAPADLCAVIGRDDLAEWVPGAEATATSDDGESTTEATCTASVDGPEVRADLTARVVRYPRRLGRTPGDSHAARQLEGSCTGAAEDDVGVGDDSCLDASGSSGSGRAEIHVRQGRDTVRVAYDADPLTAGEARARAIEAATRIVAELGRR